jgi:beta-glucosidase
VKFALGLFEHPYVDEGREASAMLRPESLELARRAAERSMVLLKNAPGPNGAPLLPLSKDTRNIALIGPLADDSSSMLGAWQGLADSKDVASFAAALAKQIGEDHILRAKGVNVIGGSDEDLNAAVATANKADLVILALGESGGEMTGEATSRAHIGLPGRQQELLEKVAATGKPVVLLIFSGRPLTLRWAFEHVPAVWAAWCPGIEAGSALVRTLYGESNPSGKLVVSWPRDVGQEPLYYNALSTGRPIDPATPDNNYVSRYIDEQNSPQFPFGFGLSYTSFKYGATQVAGKQLKASALAPKLGDSGTVLSVSADVTNTGQRAGEEIVELYVRLQGTSVAQPVRALKAFERVTLNPNETKTVTFNLPADAFALWNDQNKYTVEAVKATVWISPDSASGEGAGLEIVP